MEVPVFATVVGTGIATVGVGVTIIVLLLRGSYALGRSTAQVEGLSAGVTEVRNEVVGAVRTEVGETRAEARQDNEHLRTQVKLDVEHLRTEVKHDIQQVREEVREARAESKQDIQQVREEIREARAEAKQDIQQLRIELRQEMQELRAEARQDNRELRTEMNAGFDRLFEAISSIHVEVQQSNRMIAALANHTHDTDGRTVFTVPSPPGG